jgi:hypothetical protein
MSYLNLWIDTSLFRYGRACPWGRIGSLDCDVQTRQRRIPIPFPNAFLSSNYVPFHTAASLLMCKHEHEREPKASSSTPTIPTIYAVRSSERVHNSTLTSGLCDACNDERESGKGVLAAELSFDDITHDMSKLGIGLSEALARPLSLPDSREADDSMYEFGTTREKCPPYSSPSYSDMYFCQGRL